MDDQELAEVYDMDEEVMNIIEDNMLLSKQVREDKSIYSLRLQEEHQKLFDAKRIDAGKVIFNFFKILSEKDVGVRL